MPSDKTIEEEQPKELNRPVFYPITVDDAYVGAFSEVISHASSRLFSKEELVYRDAFNELSLDAQYFYVRLFVRKPRWIRASDCERYLPKNAVESAGMELVNGDLFLKDFELAEVLEVLALKELCSLAKDFKIKSNLITRKDDLVKSICGFATSQRSFFSGGITSKITTKILKDHGTFYKINTKISRVFNTMMRSYLCPGHAEFDQVLRSKMNMISFPKYTISTMSLFTTRADLEQFLQAQAYDDELENWTNWSVSARIEKINEILARACTVDEQKIMQSKPIYLLRYSADWMYMSTLLKLSELLRLSQQPELELQCLKVFTSQNLYRKDKRAFCLTRKAHLELTLFKSSNDKQWLHQSLNSCLEAISDPSLNDIVRLELHRKVLKVAKAYDAAKLEFPREMVLGLKGDLIEPTQVEVRGFQVVNPSGRGKTQWIDQETMGTSSVEWLALSYYKGQGWCGYHSESSVLNTLFCVLFWDIIYCDFPAFYHSYHTYPLDLFYGFYENRKEIIDNRLQEITTQGHEYVVAKIVSVLENHLNAMCVGCNWGYGTDILEIAQCLPIDAIVFICRLYCRDYRLYSSGAPDLVLWNFDKRSCKFVEVKSENDSLSDNQKVWIHNLASHGVAVELCKVLDEGRPLKKKRKA
jgi:Fanconi-associated nuclease 1